jgi:hypothetical protein
MNIDTVEADFELGVMNLDVVAKLETIAATGNLRHLIKASSRCVYATELWTAAMTAHWGPAGIHKSWTNPDGTPSAECLEKCIEVAPAMREARERIPHILASYRRYYTH